MKDRIAISVVTSANLKERYNACKNTWAKDFENIYFIGGNIKDENLISIDAGDDYSSHFLKQQIGFKYMFEQDQEFDWYGTTTCDAIFYKDAVEEMLSRHDRNEDLIIGQANCYWTDEPFIRQIEIQEYGYPQGEKYHEMLKNPRIFRALAGGAGIFLSNSLMKKCYGIIDEFNYFWKNISGHCYPYSDVALPYMIKKFFGIDITFEPNMLSQPPSHYQSALNGDDCMKYYVNYPINLESALADPISFHYIKHWEMPEIYEKYRRKS